MGDAFSPLLSGCASHYPAHMRTVALTGGIASGKSAVADRFAALGIDIIDADLVARELVEPGMPALDEIVTAFGDGVLGADGRLDRRAMRARVFNDNDARLRLEAILHPRIRTTMRQRAETVDSAYGIVAVPLLVEAWPHYAWVDRVLVVDVPREVQIARLTARDGVDRALAEAMLDAQASRERRLALADDIIENAGSLAELDAAVAALHARYLALRDDAPTEFTDRD